jgi:hypothetical protein
MAHQQEFDMNEQVIADLIQAYPNLMLIVILGVFCAPFAILLAVAVLFPKKREIVDIIREEVDSHYFEYTNVEIIESCVWGNAIRVSIDFNAEECGEITVPNTKAGLASFNSWLHAELTYSDEEGWDGYDYVT